MRRRLIFLALVVLGVVAFLAAFAFGGVRETLASVSKAGFLAFGCYFASAVLILALQTVGWKLLLNAAGHRVPYYSLCAGILMGYAGNFLTPSMYVGGEPVRAYFIGEHWGIRKRRVLATILVHKVSEFTAFLMFVYAGSVVALLHYAEKIPLSLRVAIVVLDVILTVLLVLALLSLFKNYQLTSRLMLLLSRLKIKPRFFQRLAIKAREIDTLMHEAVMISWRASLLNLFFMTMATTLMFFRPAIFFYFLRHQMPFSLPELAFLFTLTQFILALQFTPGGLGILEGGQIAVYDVVGVSAPEALAITAFSRICDIILVGTGIGLAVHYGLSSLIREGSKGMEKVKEPDVADPPQAAPGPKDGG